MVRRVLLIVAPCLLVASSFAFAQAQPSAPKATKAAPQAAGVPDKALLRQILDAWSTMNPDNPAKYYDQAPGDVFYDISPLKYVGFKAYADGVKQMFPTLSSLTFTLNDDAVVHVAGTMAWGTATVKTVMTDKAGKANNVDCRWTVIWQKKGGTWLIVHDHFSAAMEPPK
ncbi:MAG: YybH family protein [Bacteroidales bacterium]